MGLDCNQIQGFWIQHLREAQSCWIWCCSRIHLNLGKFIILINIKNIIICIRNTLIFMMINIICIINIFIFIIINIINIIIKKFKKYIINFE
jgi:hypothetical protein